MNTPLFVLQELNVKYNYSHRLVCSDITRAQTSQRTDEGEQVFLHCVFDDFRVDAGHSVDSMRSHNAEVSHVDLLDVPFFDQGHSAQAVKVSRVKLGDALEGIKTETCQWRVGLVCCKTRFDLRFEGEQTCATLKCEKTTFVRAPRGRTVHKLSSIFNNTT